MSAARLAPPLVLFTILAVPVATAGPGGELLPVAQTIGGPVEATLPAGLRTAVWSVVNDTADICLSFANRGKKGVVWGHVGTTSRSAAPGQVRIVCAASSSAELECQGTGCKVSWRVDDLG